MNRTKEVVLFALIEGIKESVANNTGNAGISDHFKDILRLVDSMECVLCDIAIGGDDES